MREGIRHQPSREEIDASLKADMLSASYNESNKDEETNNSGKKSRKGVEFVTYDPKELERMPGWSETPLKPDLDSDNKDPKKPAVRPSEAEFDLDLEDNGTANEGGDYTKPLHEREIDPNELE